jgi:diguanylate cyclase (GGDEF)-like protein
MELITVSSLMSRTVETVSVNMQLAEVVHVMRMHRISCVVVVDGQRPLGIVTERDVVRILDQVLSQEMSKESRVGDFMSSPPVCVQESTPLFDALVLCQGRNIRHLPVVDAEGRLCGILSYSDLAKTYARIIEQQQAVIESEVGYKTRQLREVNEQLKALSMEDALLNIGNRRAMEVDLTYTHNAAVRYKRPYSITLFDVDCFKQYNDHYGHQAGDVALQQVAEHIRTSIRQSDRLYRYGGEELLLLLPETELQGAIILASRIVKELAAKNIPHVASPHQVLTISAGISAPDLLNNRDQTCNEVIKQADQALYMAKGSGRNQVCCPLQISTLLQ